MKNPKRLAYPLALIGFITMTGSSLAASGEYVAPEQEYQGARLPKCRFNY